METCKLIHVLKIGVYILVITILMKFKVGYQIQNFKLVMDIYTPINLINKELWSLIQILVQNKLFQH